MSAHYLLFSGQLTEQSFNSFARELSDIWLHEGSELHLAFNSLGGITSEGHAMANMLRSFPELRIVTYNVGRVESAAALPYLVASDRVCDPSGRFMIHAPRQQMNGHYTAAVLQQALEQQREIEAAYLSEVREKTNISDITAAEILDGEVFLSADAAVASNIASRIGQFVVPRGSRLRIVGMPLDG